MSVAHILTQNHSVWINTRHTIWLAAVLLYGREAGLIFPLYKRNSSIQSNVSALMHVPIYSAYAVCVVNRMSWLGGTAFHRCSTRVYMCLCLTAAFHPIAVQLMHSGPSFWWYISVAVAIIAPAHEHDVDILFSVARMLCSWLHALAFFSRKNERARGRKRK